MNRLLITMIGLLLVQSQALAQTQDVPKYEIAAEFTSMDRNNFNGGPEVGVGARFTFNLNKNFSLETAAYHFPRTCFTCERDGTVTEVVGGLKVGKRFEKWGIFVKGRPGVVSFSRGQFNIVPAAGPSFFPFEIELHRLNSFAVDAGGVVEFYPSKRIVTRFDAGDTIIHFGRRRFNSVVSDPTGAITLFPFTSPGKTTHNFQFMASVGFRF
ncbi:MAG TPA: hypothetical protein VFI24_25165 [Pyrinomonadaceae bacterium]|nr:hypothetical protein [Pyrinomonadaceae bacterium]